MRRACQLLLLIVPLFEYECPDKSCKARPVVNYAAVMTDSWAPWLHVSCCKMPCAPTSLHGLPTGNCRLCAPAASPLGYNFLLCAEKPVAYRTANTELKICGIAIQISVALCIDRVISGVVSALVIRSMSVCRTARTRCLPLSACPSPCPATYRCPELWIWR